MASATDRKRDDLAAVDKTETMVFGWIERCHSSKGLPSNRARTTTMAIVHAIERTLLATSSAHQSVNHGGNRHLECRDFSNDSDEDCGLFKFGHSCGERS